MSLETRNLKLETLSVFFGDASDAVARVYARLDGEPAELAGLSLSGQVVGPFCEYAHTLTAQVPLADTGPGDSLVAAAAVPDPCFWTPELPFLYRVEVALRRGIETLATAERTLGIRPLGARGRHLAYHSKRFVIRGVTMIEPIAPSELSACHESATAIYVENPSDELCREASRLGILLLAQVSGQRDVIARLGRWAAVAVAVIDASGSAEAASDLRAAAPNLLLAQRGTREMRPADWAQLVVCDAGDIERVAAQVKDVSLPVLAYRPLQESIPLTAARAACDELQRDLAPVGDFAGYLV